MCLYAMCKLCWFYEAVHFSERVADKCVIWRWNSGHLSFPFVGAVGPDLFEWTITTDNEGLEP